ncbi:MAG: hypothetical protein WKF70_14790 [Chitinophagaceae bacterium]
MRNILRKEDVLVNDEDKGNRLVDVEMIPFTNERNIFQANTELSFWLPAQQTGYQKGCIRYRISKA